jgi:arylformamidase
MPRILISVMLSLAVTHTALAQSVADRFGQFDQNQDGVVTKEEARGAAWFDRLCQRLDANRDGKLQRSEVEAMSRRTRQLNRRMAQVPQAPPHRKVLNIEYHKVPGVDPNLLSLDLYVPAEAAAEKRPTMIMIHGGGWRTGDKANATIIGAKMPYFLKHGYIYASVNYRLSPQKPGGKGVKHPVHVEDCARALAWIHDHIAEYGGDPAQLHLMGHSAGAHLAGLIGTNERFLKAVGKDLSIIKTNVLLDTAAINIPGYLDEVGQQGMSALYTNAFGTDREALIDASPFQHVTANKSIPPTILFYGGDRMGLHKFGPQFAKAMTAAGSPSQAIDTVDLDHGQINFNVGMPGDEMTKLIMKLHAGEDASRFVAVLPSKDNQEAKPSTTPKAAPKSER